MKNQQNRDERVVMQRRKIQSEAFTILIYVLLLSVPIQQFVLGAPFEQFAVEFICVIGISIYIIFRNFMLGHSIFGEGKRAKTMPVVNALVVGFTVTVINGILNYRQHSDIYMEDGMGLFFAILAITFISATGICFILLFIINYFNKCKQDKIQKQLDADEQED